MKRNVILPAVAAFVFSIVSLSLTAQPNFRGGASRPSPEYRQNALPSAPYVIIDGDGRWSNFQGNRFDGCTVGQSLSRKQRKQLEKRFGYVPPQVLYVPDRFVGRNGVFVYNNGVVYSRDRDGYFHLDNRYFSDRWDDNRNNDYRNNSYGWNDNIRNRY